MIEPGTFATVFCVIFVAELPDKTAVAALVLATRHRPLPVFAGTALALVVQSLVAVAAGGLFALLPARLVHIGAGLLFLVSAIFMWRRVEEDEGEGEGNADQPEGFRHAFLKSFLVVFIAEWGDLTQIGTAALAAHYRAPVTVFLAATVALCLVAALAVFLGNRMAKLIHPRHAQRVAAVVFVALGVGILFQALKGAA